MELTIEEKKGLLHLRTQKERKTTSRASEYQYNGGMLPRHKVILRAEQEREKGIQRRQRSVNAYNKEGAKTAVERRCKKGPSFPAPCLALITEPVYEPEVEYARKLHSQAIVFNAYTEGEILKRRRQEQEEREIAERVEKEQRAQDYLVAKRELQQQKKMQIQQLQKNNQAEVAKQLEEINKKQEARARREEAEREKRARAEHQLHLQREQEEKAKKEAALKDTARYICKQVRDKNLEKQQQQMNKLCSVRPMKPTPPAKTPKVTQQTFRPRQTEEKKGLLHLRKQERKTPSRGSEYQYNGGMLPRHKDIMRAEQEREQGIQCHQKSVHAYNKEGAKTAVERRCKKGPSFPAPCLALITEPAYEPEEVYARKLRSQRIVVNAYTECEILKRRRLEQEERELAERAEKQQCAEDYLAAKRELQQQKKMQIQQLQQNNKAEVAKQLEQINEKQMARVHREEAEREKRARAEHQLHLQREQEEKAKKDAALRETAMYWCKQMRDKDMDKQHQQMNKFCSVRSMKSTPPVNTPKVTQQTFRPRQTEEKKGLPHLRKQKERKTPSRGSECQYGGDMLPRHKVIMRAEQEREQVRDKDLRKQHQQMNKHCPVRPMKPTPSANTPKVTQQTFRSRQFARVKSRVVCLNPHMLTVSDLVIERYCE